MTGWRDATAMDLSEARIMLAAEVVEQDVLRLHTQVSEHLDDRGVHHGRAAHVELAILRSRMVLQIVLVQHVVDEAGRAVPVVFRQRIGQRQMPLEVRVLGLQLIVLFDVEGLAHGARTVPEAHLALGLQTLELIEDVRTHRRHAGTTTDEDHLGIGVLGEELTEGSVDGDLVARLEAEHVGRHLARRHIVTPRRRRRDTDVEFDDALLFRVVRHGVGTNGGLVDLRHVLPEVELVPVATEFRLDVEILVMDGMRRALQLHVATGAEVDVLALGQTKRQLLDEGGHVGIGLHRALPLLHAEDFFRDLDLHVRLDRGLAGQTPSLTGLTTGEVRLLGGQHLAATALDDALALRAGTAAATGGREEDVVGSQGLQQLAAGRHGDGSLTVDFDGHVAAGHQLGARSQDDHHQRKHDGGEHTDGEENFVTHQFVPSLQLYARERHEAQRHQSDGDEGDAKPLQTIRHVAVLELLANTRQQRDRQRPGQAGAHAVHHALAEVVVALDHEQRATHDGAVHGDQRQEHAQRVVQAGYVLIERHLENLHDGRDHTDVAQQTQEAQVHFRQAGPGQRTALEQVGVDQVVGRYGDGLHHDDRDTQTDGGFHLLRDRDEGTHAEEERQGHVLDEHGADEQADVMLH